MVSRSVQAQVRIGPANETFAGVSRLWCYGSMVHGLATSAADDGGIGRDFEPGCAASASSGGPTRNSRGELHGWVPLFFECLVDS